MLLPSPSPLTAWPKIPGFHFSSPQSPHQTPFPHCLSRSRFPRPFLLLIVSSHSLGLRFDLPQFPRPLLLIVSFYFLFLRFVSSQFLHRPLFPVIVSSHSLDFLFVSFQFLALSFLLSRPILLAYCFSRPNCLAVLPRYSLVPFTWLPFCLALIPSLFPLFDSLVSFFWLLFCLAPIPSGLSSPL